MTPVRPFLLGLALLALCGCRPKDPLDWKIDAPNPAELEYWCEKNTPNLPAELAKELNTSIRTIIDLTPRAHSLRTDRDFFNEEDPACVQIHRTTVRHTIITGYLMQNEALSLQLLRESGNLLTNTQNLENPNLPADQRKVWERAIARQQSMIDQLKTLIEANRRRVAELSAGAG